ncbi:hypothetical protein IMY05_C4715000300 [Salix suchowensis]|nr:hypothetical protein IMY05_C4715000300 [Salix suchowensis]
MDSDELSCLERSAQSKSLLSPEGTPDVCAIDVREATRTAPSTRAGDIYEEYERTGYVWEQYNAMTGEGQRSSPISYWRVMPRYRLALTTDEAGYQAVNIYGSLVADVLDSYCFHLYRMLVGMTVHPTMPIPTRLFAGCVAQLRESGSILVQQLVQIEGYNRSNPRTPKTVASGLSNSCKWALLLPAGRDGTQSQSISPRMLQPLSESDFNLDVGGIVGFLGGEEAISAMESMPFYKYRKWLGWYNSPGSYTIAKHFGKLPVSRFWDGIYPGANDDPATLLGLDGKRGPKFRGVVSGTALGHTGHVAQAFTQYCRSEVKAVPSMLSEARKEGQRTTTTTNVTIADFLVRTSGTSTETRLEYDETESPFGP